MMMPILGPKVDSAYLGLFGSLGFWVSFLVGQAHAEERSSREKAEEFHQQVGTAARCTLHFLDTHSPICTFLCRFMESSKWAMVLRVTQP